MERKGTANLILKPLRNGESSGIVVQLFPSLVQRRYIPTDETSYHKHNGYISVSKRYGYEGRKEK